jgi:tetratricopeptide (TPR) repeat protein/energy-coupling factor transporter ATP-binding protein EcfA2
MSSGTGSVLRFYNPDWLSDDDLVAGFIARRDLFEFLRDELRRAPLHGNVQHYLLVGVRGSGKTSLLKRLAVAIRHDTALSDHLIGLSFPEELYEVKGLSDFWWAACKALDDALDRIGQRAAADRLAGHIAAHETQGLKTNPHDDAGLRLLLNTCVELQRRPVLLVDNLDLVLKRIDKTGRKVKDPQSHAYWALREVLSTIDAPVVIGGSVRLSEPLVGHDNAFYDYFIPKRLGKLSLDEVREIFAHLARTHGGDQLQQRIRKRPGRVQALYEMTGGNPRALGLIFELLRQGPNSSAVDAFEQLLDLTTPYYKARFEELAEQAQVVMHALALSRREQTKAAFGHTAAAIARRAGLETRIVSAQLDVLVNEGVVEKNSSSKGRTQYRVAEQLFRLWLQMRSTRRIRQQVIGLTEFLEVLFDRDEHENLIQGEVEGPQTSSLRSRAKMSLALSELQHEKARRYNLETRAADAMLQASAAGDGSIEEAFAPGDLPRDIEFLNECRGKLQRCAPWHQILRADAAALARDLLGSLSLNAEQKRASVMRLCERKTAADEFARFAPLLAQEREALLRDNLSTAEIDLLYTERASGRLALPHLTPADVQLPESSELRSLTWKLLGARRITFTSLNEAKAWIAWGKHHFPKANSSDWVAVARAMRLARHLEAAKSAVKLAFINGECSRAWYEHGRLIEEQNGDPNAAEYAYRRAIELDPTDAWPWSNLGALLDEQLNRYDEAEAAFRKAIDLGPTNAVPWANLGYLLENGLERYDEAADAYTRSLELDAENDVARCRLASVRSRKVMVSIASAAEAGDWSGVREQLSAWIAATDQGPLSWLVGESFVENIVGRALRRGHGPQILAILREANFDTIAAPLLLALDAAIDGGIEKLSTVEPEVRSAALRIFERLQSTDATLP